VGNGSRKTLQVDEPLRPRHPKDIEKARFHAFPRRVEGSFDLAQARRPNNQLNQQENPAPPFLSRVLYEKRMGGQATLYLPERS
jgi:hypothetical protein